MNQDSDSTQSTDCETQISGLKFRRWWLIVVALSVLSYWFYHRSRPNTQAESETAYRAPELPLPAPAELLSSDQPPPAEVQRRVSSLEEVLQLARSLEARVKQDVHDYTATIIKRERVGGQLGDEEHMEVKIRNPREQDGRVIPFSVYLKFVPPSTAAGREVLWVAGRDDGQLLSYQFRIPVKLDPNGTLAMIGNKYPITEIGILKLAEKLIEKGERDAKLGPCEVEIFENQISDGRSCQLIQVTHRDRKSQYDFHIAQIYIDNELQVPIHYAAYLWPETAGAAPPLEEEYRYRDLRLNVGLNDNDFDPENSNYNFP